MKIQKRIKYIQSEDKSVTTCESFIKNDSQVAILKKEHCKFRIL